MTKNLCQADMARRLGLTPCAFAAKVYQGKLDVSDFPLVGKVRVFPEDAVEVIRARPATTIGAWSVTTGIRRWTATA
jgi:hypothetical protein